MSETRYIYDREVTGDELPGRKYLPVISEGHSLGTVCRRELGIKLDKRYQRSNWSRRPLTPAQLNYAALDAEVLIDLHRLFQEEAGRKRR